MVGNGLLAFVVFATVAIFLYMSFRFQRKADRVQTYEGIYRIEVDGSFAGDSLTLYLNDSLLLDRTFISDTLTLEIARFAEENVLLVVNNQTDNATPFNLSSKGSRIELKKNGNVIYILEKEADGIWE